VTAFVIAEIQEITDHQGYADYRARVDATVAEAGGRYIVRTNSVSVLEGSWRPQRLVVVQFATEEAARAWWAGEAYRELKALRQTASRANLILVEGSRHVP
jgi:uncharacterized protein (DUF1330 family)